MDVVGLHRPRIAVDQKVPPLTRAGGVDLTDQPGTAPTEGREHWWYQNLDAAWVDRLRCFNTGCAELGHQRG